MNYEVEEDDEINSVLWVGNLDSKVTEAMVYELFLQVRTNTVLSVDLSL